MSLPARIGARHPKLVGIIEEMEDNLEEPLSPSVLAKQAGLSTRQLERLFRRYLDRSPKRYYLELRLKKARSLLLQTDMSVINVALACGFSSPSHFSKCYRAFYGRTPYRERGIPVVRDRRGRPRQRRPLQAYTAGRLAARAGGRRAVERSRLIGAAIHRRRLGDDRRPRPEPGLVSSSRRPRFSASPRLSAGRPGPSSSTDDFEPVRALSVAERRAGRRSTAMARLAHLQALSRRFPAISSRSCCSPRNLSRACRTGDVDDPFRRWMRSSVRARASSTGSTSVSRAQAVRPGGAPGAVEIERHLVAHDRRSAPEPWRRAALVDVRLVGEHAERRLQRMGEIADLGAGALDDLAVGLDAEG